MDRIATFVVLLAILCSAVPLYADTAADRRIADLQAQITALEEQLAAKDAQIAQLQQQLRQLQQTNTNTEVKAAQDAARLAAKRRIGQDYAKYPRQHIQAAENLYQVANRNWRSPEAKASLEKMIQQYKDLNRTGCALLYLGRMSEGAERERYLKLAIDKYGDCYYGDGVCVGAYARYILGQDYFTSGNKEAARPLFGELRKDYPKAIDHHGEMLVLQLPLDPPGL